MAHLLVWFLNTNNSLYKKNYVNAYKVIHSYKVLTNVVRVKVTVKIVVVEIPMRVLNVKLN